MQLADVLTVERVAPEMRSTSKKEALEELSGLLAGADAPELRQPIARVLAERERLASTAIGDEVAIPHGKLDAVGRLVLGLARSREGIDFESVDGKPTRLFFVLVAPENSTGVHLKALARISRLCKEPLFRAQLLQAASAEEMYHVLCEEDAKFTLR
jgi:PTS system nitrogen regulatory IIA component